jgi:23S rRNA pseudouridine1911/1915/1917 synthase
MPSASHTVRFVIPEADDGLRLDQALARHVPGLSRRRARVLLDIGGVFVDKQRVKVAGRPVRTGQTVEANLGGALQRAAAEGMGVAARERTDAALPPHRIVHEDEHIIVVEKPAGLVTAPTPESDRGNLLDLLNRRPGEGQVFLVHRLDMPTSGLLVFARTPEANRVLGERFVSHDIERAYLAVVAGAWPEELVRIDRPITGRRAVTHVLAREVLGDGAASLVRFGLETGRSHQIRIHAQHAGHPVFGDTRHGADQLRGLAVHAPRLALHATVLGFVHPATGERVRWESPLPDELATWVEGLRGKETP